MTMMWGNMVGRVALTASQKTALKGLIEAKLKSAPFMAGRLSVTTDELWAAIKDDPTLPAKIDGPEKLEQFGPEALGA